MKRFLKIILSIVIVLVVVIAGSIFYITWGLDTGSKLQINSVDISSLADGNYPGSYDFGRWSNEVSVTIKDHKITQIAIVKDVAFPEQECTEQMISRVMEKQNTDVDVVAGATVTSKSYLKSIENALKQK